jgi:hypothetical protein
MWIDKLRAAAALIGLAGPLAGPGLSVNQAPPAGPQAAEQVRAVPTAPPPADKLSRASKSDLTPQSLPGLQALIRPQDNEWRHLRVQWLTDPVAALRKAATEDKPIVFLYLGGAGYNAPLGVC